MADILGRSISPNRFNMLMLMIFSGLALTLAAIGVYGLTAYAVAQRRREIGIRVSLGASPAQLVRGLLIQGIGMCAAGTAAGLVGALLLGRLLRSLLFGISATDAVTMIVVAATIWRSWRSQPIMPASRASSVDPMLALRQE